MLVGLWDFLSLSFLTVGENTCPDHSYLEVQRDKGSEKALQTDVLNLCQICVKVDDPSV